MPVQWSVHNCHMSVEYQNFHYSLSSSRYQAVLTAKTMACNTGAVGGLLHFSNKARHISTTKTQYPWRYQSK